MKCRTYLLKCCCITGASLIEIEYDYDREKIVFEILLLSNNLEVIKKYQTENSEDAEKCYEHFLVGRSNERVNAINDSL